MQPRIHALYGSLRLPIGLESKSRKRRSIAPSCGGDYLAVRKHIANFPRSNWLRAFRLRFLGFRLLRLRALHPRLDEIDEFSRRVRHGPEHLLHPVDQVLDEFPSRLGDGFLELLLILEIRIAFLCLKCLHQHTHNFGGLPDRRKAVEVPVKLARKLHCLGFVAGNRQRTLSHLRVFRDLLESKVQNFL